ncbi:protein ZNF365 isoform X2 [Dunckerocampus dactyliophorus]|uniref:protein ZNF365 isoform X2 n=1 Tax=Dunckerocampus dactyliophorus TaxID=161453 RepID=UPI0024073E51|nr:protein ZNF365 isoform X2 [Dunckerocampus dactyliophorus]
MQQKLCSGSFHSERGCNEPLPSCDLPFRCPRCGEQERFHSMDALHAHLEYRHSYRSPDEVGGGGFSITGKLPPDSLSAAASWQDMSLPTCRGQQSAGRPPHVRSLSDSRDGAFMLSYSSVRRRTHSVGVGTQAEEEVGGAEAEEKLDSHHRGCLPPTPDLDWNWDLPGRRASSGSDAAAASAAVRRRLASMLRAADSSVQRRLARVSTELAHTDTQLLCERAHSQHLSQERQEVADRERSLSRQVDVAVMVIAALKEQINASENELERRERQVITIQKFLEAAARQETSGKVRIQCFIENLLRRIALAERLLEYYQVNGSPPQHHQCTHQQTSDGRPHRMTKSRSAGGQLSSSGLHGNTTPPPPSRPSGGRDQEREQRERLARSSRLFCRPEHRDDIWNQRRRSAGYEA